MSDELQIDDVRRRASAVGVALDDLRLESVIRLASPTHGVLPASIADTIFEDEPSGFEVALASGVRR